MKFRWTDLRWNDFLGEAILGEVILGEMILGGVRHSQKIISSSVFGKRNRSWLMLVLLIRICFYSCIIHIPNSELKLWAYYSLPDLINCEILSSIFFCSSPFIIILCSKYRVNKWNTDIIIIWKNNNFHSNCYWTSLSTKVNPHKKYFYKLFLTFRLLRVDLCWRFAFLFFSTFYSDH
jgi:hypothetical protein